MTGWHRVLLPYATFAILVEEGQVTDAAPIGRWMIGKTETVVTRWVQSKNGRIEELHA